MRVLVTGSHGFIGSQLVAALRERGDEVIEWDLKNNRDILMPPHIEWMGGLDEVYHLACVNQEEAMTQKKRNLMVNAYGAGKMAKLAASRGARFVYTSTASVYGNAVLLPTQNWYREDPKSEYAVAKLAGEQFVKLSGADFTIFRLSNVYGPGQTTENPYCGVVAKFVDSAKAGKPLQIIGDGSQTRDFTYVGDILPHLMNSELKGTLNVSHSAEVLIIDLALDICRQLGVPRTLEYVSERSVDGIQRRWLNSDVLCPTSLEEGLKLTINAL